MPKQHSLPRQPSRVQPFRVCKTRKKSRDSPWFEKLPVPMRMDLYKMCKKPREVFITATECTCGGSFYVQLPHAPDCTCKLVLLARDVDPKGAADAAITPPMQDLYELDQHSATFKRRINFAHDIFHCPDHLLEMVYWDKRFDKIRHIVVTVRPESPIFKEHLELYGSTEGVVKYFSEYVQGVWRDIETIVVQDYMAKSAEQLAESPYRDCWQFPWYFMLNYFHGMPLPAGLRDVTIVNPYHDTEPDMNLDNFKEQCAKMVQALDFARKFD